MLFAGTCRISFHPICAREARHKMEVWGRFGCDNASVNFFPEYELLLLLFICNYFVLILRFPYHQYSLFFLQIELRAFCSKHSEIHDNSSSPQHGELCASGTDSSITNQLSLQSMDNSQNSKISLSNGDKIAVGLEGLDDKSGDGELQEIDVSGTRSNALVASECGEAQNLVDVGLLERTNDDEHKPFNSLNFAMILKKVFDPVILRLIILSLFLSFQIVLSYNLYIMQLIDRGKVNVKDIASEIGLSADFLSASLNVIPAIVVTLFAIVFCKQFQFAALTFI